MARYYGRVGYISTSESPSGSGNWVETIDEHWYSGEILSDKAKWTAVPDSTNDDITIMSKISFLADPFAYANYSYIRYAFLNGVPWKVTSVDPQRPRIVITLGGVWNGSVAEQQT